MARRKKVVSPVLIGDIVVMRDWHDEWIDVRVQKFGESKTLGPTIEGVQLDNGMAWRFVALPLDRKVETARVHSEKRGKWVIELPDETVEYAKSKKAAQALCVERGVVMQEVLK